MGRVALLASLCASACSSPPGPITIGLETSSTTTARVSVTGLSSTEASALSRAALAETEWRQLLRVTSSENAEVPVAGTYRVDDATLYFEPAFPFDPGRPYSVRFDPSQLPEPRAGDAVTAVVALPAGQTAPLVSVQAIYPSADEWPANLLRFYVYFSGTMSRETGVGRVRLVDDGGEEIADALLPAAADFWSPDQTRYTVFFEPGRVKRGIQPNLESGRALVPGRTYTITIDRAWRDAAGRPLAAPFTKTFRAGPPREAPLSMTSWQISSPRGGSRDPLTVKVPWPLDRALFLRTVGVTRDGQPVDGAVEVTAGETEWRLTPSTPWARGAHELVVLSALEDPSGNRIGRAFEVLPTDPAANQELPERFTKQVLVR